MCIFSLEDIRCVCERTEGIRPILRAGGHLDSLFRQGKLRCFGSRVDWSKIRMCIGHLEFLNTDSLFIREGT